MSKNKQATESASHGLRIAAGSLTVEGEWCVPVRAVGIVLFAHGSGSSRHSPRNQAVARLLQESGTETLLFDLLTGAEEAEDAKSAALRFDGAQTRHGGKAGAARPRGARRPPGV